ncbi:beta-propeller domain-containing protein [Myxococcota bacterium]|nr:beta-propeller domain-containing protein [Myxococcota bacterium]
MKSLFKHWRLGLSDVIFTTIFTTLLTTALFGCNTTVDDISLIERTRTTAALVSFDSCDELGDRIKENLIEEMRVQLLQQENNYYYGSPEMDDSVAADGGTNEASGDTREEGVDFSGTNNQETGVDEADFVKTDGFHIYTLNGQRLEIFGVPNFGELVRESTTEIEGYPSQMMVGDDAAVIFSQIYSWNLPQDHPLREHLFNNEDQAEWGWYRSSVLTKLTVIDITDREAPAVSRELYFEGYYQTARRIEESVRMVSYAYMDIQGLTYWPELPDAYYDLDYEDPRRDEIWDDAILDTIAKNTRLIRDTPLAEMVPRIYERLANDQFVLHAYTNEACQNFAIADDGMSRGFTSILTIDLASEAFSFEADHIVSNWSTVYASLNTMIIAEYAHDWWWFWGHSDYDEATNIHRFDISEPGTTVYTGSGRVDGLVEKQFNLSELDGDIRVATTTGWWWRWWLEEEQVIESHVFVLRGDHDLEVIGHVGGIGEGERLWSSRFVGDKAYLVTFQNIDPLWTISLADPTDPQIIGELEVPGVSTYIHPLGDSHLLNIGYGGDDGGLDWSVQLSLFDVSDFANPTLQDSEPLAAPVGEGWYWSWSEAAWEHKAFQYWDPDNDGEGMLAVPASSYRSNYNDEGYYSYDYYSRLELFSISTENGIENYGSIDHSSFFNSDPDHWWSWRDVRRSIFMGDFIYAISHRGITVHKVDGLELRVSMPMQGDDETPYWNY